MNPMCAKCKKIVYPTEKLNCLDKIWHKGCFKCEKCNMTLNMKNYKGYDKLPYCNAHYPTTKHTQVADTPENRRIADNTKIQSNIAYHKDFEESKGSYIQVEDPVELRQHLKNTENISLIKYHEEFEKSKGEISQISDTVDMQRHKKNVENFSLIQYHADFERQKGKKMTVVDDPETQRAKQNTQNISNAAYSGHKEILQDMEYKRPAEQVNDVRVRPNPGSIQHYDPMRDQQQNQGTPYSQRNSGAVVYDSSTGRGLDMNFNAKIQPFHQHYDNIENPSSQRKVGSISDYDPMNDRWGSVTGQTAPQQQQQPRNQPPPPQQYAPPPQEADKFAGKGMVCRAAYDYAAADDDEVSFSEGDFVIFCQPIDAGWMEGTVEATGRRGMLPSNYVETVKK